MADLKNRLRADLTTAMKAREELRTATLRMVLAAVSAEEVAGKEARELTDDEVLAQAVLQVGQRILLDGARRPRAQRRCASAWPRTLGHGLSLARCGDRRRT